MQHIETQRDRLAIAVRLGVPLSSIRPRTFDGSVLLNAPASPAAPLTDITNVAPVMQVVEEVVHPHATYTDKFSRWSGTISEEARLNPLPQMLITVHVYPSSPGDWTVMAGKYQRTVGHVWEILFKDGTTGLYHPRYSNSTVITKRTYDEFTEHGRLEDVGRRGRLATV